jgi:hypothetical protein
VSTIKLSLRKEAFQQVLSGKKKYEYRDVSEWIESRLLKDNTWRKYEFIEFTNGYGYHKPWLKCRFKGVSVMKRGETLGGFKCAAKTYAIRLGEIIQTRNIR